MPQSPARARAAFVRAAIFSAIAAALPLSAQQPPELGIAAVKVADTPYTFDTAEQHGIRVSVVVRGLNHP
jgi:hypothetical protein